MVRFYWSCLCVLVFCLVIYWNETFFSSIRSQRGMNNMLGRSSTSQNYLGWFPRYSEFDKYCLLCFILISQKLSRQSKGCFVHYLAGLKLCCDRMSCISECYAEGGNTLVSVPPSFPRISPHPSSFATPQSPSPFPLLGANLSAIYIICWGGMQML